MCKKGVSVFLAIVSAGGSGANAGPLEPAASSNELIKKELVSLPSGDPLVEKLIQSNILTIVETSLDRAGNAYSLAAAALEDATSQPAGQQKWIACSYKTSPDYESMSRAPQWKTKYDACTVYSGIYQVYGSSVSFDELKTLTALDLLNLVGTPVPSAAAE